MSSAGRFRIQARLVLGGARQLTLFDTAPIRALVPVRQPERIFHLSFGWPRIIGVELNIIGSDPDAPLFYAPTEPMRPQSELVIVPAPRIIEEHPYWTIHELLKGLRGDPGLVAGVLALASGLAWWFWLAHGGEAIGIAQRGAGGLLVSMLVLYMPIYLCVASCICMIASILPELDFIAMDLQRR